MTGVVVSTETRIGPSAPLRSPSAQFFVVGLTERGDTAKPILIRGMSDVDTYLGARVSYGAVYDQLQTFFDEGGLQAYVGRIVGASATKGTLTLVDRAGTPLNTIRVDAQNAGSWSTQITVEVQDGSLSNTFRIIVRLNGTIVHDFNNIATPADAVTKFSTSKYVVLTDLGSATVAPNNNPAVLSATALSAGNDDRGSVVSATYVAGLSLFTPDLGDGCVAIPGQTVNAIWVGIQAHCEANNRIGILSAASGDTKSTLLTRVAEIDSAWCGLFVPWVKVSDGGTGTRTISPEGYVAACRSRAIDQVGPWRPPAGEIAKSTSILDLANTFLTADADDLDSARVNVIRSIAGGFRLYGWRSMSTDTDNYYWLSYRDMLNMLVIQAGKILEQYVFAIIDAQGQVLSAVNATLVGLMDPIAKVGGLYARFDDTGKQLDPGYKVITGSEVNTPTTLAANELHARVLVRLDPAASLVELRIVKTPTLSGM